MTKSSTYKLLLMTLLSLSVIGVGTTSAEARGNKTCRVETTDVGLIIGKGRSADAAFEDAATQCFERHSRVHQSKTGRAPDEALGLEIIDTCANLRCDS